MSALFVADAVGVGDISPGISDPSYPNFGCTLSDCDLAIPKGYAAVMASGGPNSDDNPIGLRQHDNPDYTAVAPLNSLRG